MKSLFDNNGNQFNLLDDKDILIENNDNGYYIKFPSGILIQFGTIEKWISLTKQHSFTGHYYDDGYVVQFPHIFVDNFYFANVMYATNSQNLWVYSCSNFELNGFLFNLMSIQKIDNDHNAPFKWFAIGKWK